MYLSHLQPPAKIEKRAFLPHVELLSDTQPTYMAGLPCSRVRGRGRKGRKDYLRGETAEVAVWTFMELIIVLAGSNILWDPGYTGRLVVSGC